MLQGDENSSCWGCSTMVLRSSHSIQWCICLRHNQKHTYNLVAIVCCLWIHVRALIGPSPPEKRSLPILHPVRVTSRRPPHPRHPVPDDLQVQCCVLRAHARADHISSPLTVNRQPLTNRNLLTAIPKPLPLFPIPWTLKHNRSVNR